MKLIEKIKNIIEAKRMLSHPFYRDWMEGKLSLPQLKNYAAQYTPFVDAFPRFVSAAHSMCENNEAREMLLDNLMDEEGKSYSEPHPKLWRDFHAGLGDSVAINQQENCATELKNVFLDVSQSSFEESICALYAYECQIPEVAKAKIEGLEKNYGITDEKTLKFFQVHEKADVYHSQACEKIIESIAPEHEEKVLKSVEKTTDALWTFLTAVHH